MSRLRSFESCNVLVSLTDLGRRLARIISAPLLFAALGVTPAHAILNDGFFELDGNATKDTSGSADDWSSFYPTVPAGKRATGIIPDTTPAVFRSGSKDTDDISAWRYDLGSSPPKDDIVHAYAVAYTATANGTSGDLLIYFGADRKVFSGTASLGFWFFKQQVTRNEATHSFVNGATNTAATHTEGDTLVAFEYTNGGAVTGVRVYKWHNGSLVQNALVGLAATNKVGVFCDASDYICGSTNSSSITLATGETVAAGQFFEGGINVSKLVGGDLCFASFMATSRSSDTISASIKNFLVGSFPVCHLTVTKACDTSEYQSATDTILFTVKGAIVNDGNGSLSNITLVDSPAFNAGSLQYFACDGGQPTGSAISLPSSLGVGQSVCYRGKYTSSTFSKYDEVTASASTGSGTVSGTANTTCTATSPTPGLSVTKACDLDLVAQSGQLGVKVNFGGSVTNDGQVTLTNVTVCEKNEGATSCNATINVGTLAPGQSLPYAGYYMPSLALNGSGVWAATRPDTVVFKDQTTATGTLPVILGGTAVSSGLPVEATCTLCSNTAP